MQTRSKSSTCISYRRKSPAQHANFLNATNESIFYSTTQITDSQKAFDSFYSIALLLLDIHYPVKSVTITSADPDYMTAEIKSLLRKKNTLMPAHKIEMADAIALKIGHEIAKHNSIG